MLFFIAVVDGIKDSFFFFFVSELENPCLVFIGGPFNAKKKKNAKKSNLEPRNNKKRK